MSFEEYLRANGHLTYPIVGVSMLPLLRQDRDVVSVERKTAARCAPGDVVLYRRGGRYVLHRVIAVRPEDYVILGDNCAAKEYGTTDADILGVMSGFIRNGREHRVEEPAYRLYTWWMLHFIGPRIALKGLWRRCRSLAGRCLRRLGWRRGKA